MRDRSLIRSPLAVAVLLVAAALAVAGGTETFTETNETDFSGGEADGIVWTSLGALRLGRAVEGLLEETDGVDYVADMAEAPDGTVYVATGGDGRVYRMRGGNKVELHCKLPDKYLFSCIVGDDGVLYVGSGGTKGRIFRVTARPGAPVEPEPIFEDDQVKYVWDLGWLEAGVLVAATGDEGRLFRVPLRGDAEVLVDSEADHLLCLAVAPDGTLYAGTDGEGMVYRWSGKEAFVLYDAEEPEITGLAVGPDAELYVGASGGKGGRTGGVSVTQATIRIEPPEGPEPSPSAILKEKTDEAEADDIDADDGDSDGADEAEGDGESDDEANGSASSSPSPAQTIAQKLREAVQAAARRAAATRAAAAGGTGASVYRISADGIAERIFQGTDRLLLAVALTGGKLMVGTGDDGRIYEVDLADTTDQAAIADIDPKQVMALHATRDGRVVAGTASPGRLYAISKGFAREGTYTSKAHDTSGSSRWGMLHWRGRTPAGTTLELMTRTGNVNDPEKGMWSAWSKPMRRSPAKIVSPPARFIQFRVTMRSPRDDQTPVLEQLEAAYLRTNEPPTVQAVELASIPTRGSQAQAAQRARQAAAQARGRAGQGGSRPQPPSLPSGPQSVQIIQWQATDPNGDELVYDIYFRGQGEPVWILLDEDLLQNRTMWDTSTVADGWYEIKVVASDRMANPAEDAREDAKISDPVLVDNTAPLVERVDARAEGEGLVVSFRAADATSRIVEAYYTVDSSNDWQFVAPTDRLFDEMQETFEFTLTGLSPGPHRLAIRVADLAGNTGHSARTLHVAE